MRILFLLFILISSLSCRKYVWNNPNDTGSTNHSSEPASLKSGLVAYYPFNGNANDESGNGYIGIINGAKLTSDRKGKTNSAFNFNNSDIISNISNANFTNDFTISVWVKSENPTSQYPTIIQGANQFLTIQYGTLYLGSPTALFYFEGSFPSGNTGGNVLGVVDLARWNLIVIRNLNFQTSVFINGVLIQTNTDSTPNQSSITGSFIKIGNGLQLPQGAFVGSLDDIRIYNRALSQEEITYLANH